MRSLSKTALIPLLALVAACTPKPEQLRQVLLEHPDIFFDIIEKNPTKFAEVTQRAIMQARHQSQQVTQEAQEEQLKHPNEVPIEADRAVRGDRHAPIVLVEYSDFQCPFCQMGFQRVEELRQKYGDKLQVVYKHFPLQMHPMALPAAKRFEAIANQSIPKAWKFHDELFQHQNEMSRGETFLDEAARKAGADIAKMKKAMESDAVRNRIEEDTREAKSLGFRGTPGFLLNGVTLRGALPITAFDAIIAKRPSYH